MKVIFFLTLICMSLGTILSAQGTLDVMLSDAAPDPAELPIDLTEEGIIDWICWGTVEGQDDRKEGVTLQIGMELINPNPDPGGEPMEAPFWYGNETNITFEWGDGTPTAEAENIDGGLWMPTPGNGFTITAPADPETRVLTLYTGLWEADGLLTASLSDESAPEVEQELLNIAEEDYPNVRVWTITYKAGGAEETLNIDWVVTANYDVAYGGYGNVTILAATLAAGGTGVESGTSEMPATHRLYQNYPNPFNPSTQIVYELSVPSVVQIAIYDLSGREIRSLENGYQNAGHHRIVWDGRDKSGSDVVSGLYIARLRVGDFVQNQKMMLVR